MPKFTAELIQAEVSEIIATIPAQMTADDTAWNLGNADPRWGVMPRELAGRLGSILTAVNAMNALGVNIPTMLFFLAHSIFLAGRRMGLLEAACGMERIAQAVDMTSRDGGEPR